MLAMRDLYGIHDATEGIRLEGATDMRVVAAMLDRAGVEPDRDAMTRVFSHYIGHLGRQLETRGYRPLGDVSGTVEALRAAGAIVGLGTGNVREGACLKLRAAGLGDLFDLDLGGYGCDSPVRAEILACAVARCDAAPGTQVVVVGDTRHDVTAARAIGAKVVGVAATPESYAELTQAGADHIAEACGDELVRFVLTP
jgi:phosphoglycolate phosphatase-like HAD superfamily hydrolase